MRGFPLLILVLLTAGCSCQRTPTDDPDSSTPTTSATDTGTTAHATTATDATPAPARQADPDTSRGEQTTPEMTVHRYLELLMTDRANADRMWAGGQPAPQPDDAALRSMLVDAGSLRILTRAAVPLDRETPHRALEIPVDLRMTKDGAPLRYKGWYRVRRTIDGAGWELSSASVQVELQ